MTSTTPGQFHLARQGFWGTPPIPAAFDSCENREYHSCPCGNQQARRAQSPAGWLDVRVPHWIIVVTCGEGLESAAAEETRDVSFEFIGSRDRRRTAGQGRCQTPARANPTRLPAGRR